MAMASPEAAHTCRCSDLACDFRWRHLMRPILPCRIPWLGRQATLMPAALCSGSLSVAGANRKPSTSPILKSSFELGVVQRSAHRSATVWGRQSGAVGEPGTVQARTSLAMAPKPRLNLLSAGSSAGINDPLASPLEVGQAETEKQAGAEILRRSSPTRTGSRATGATRGASAHALSLLDQMRSSDSCPALDIGPEPTYP